ncbi:Ubiquitin carboxyl-terminal hydrolase [Aphelenchoides besseyi]|nr:Ubiquitin carboxyl-terminal hydrolase [Aphelenchoides besseyi]KAI6209413.1 Ubiquitin carboxyl-terminal hydrolase [Aphelenchoides besseyi]
MGSAGDWTLIESDPGVFSELIHGFGATGLQVEELYCLDFDQLKDFQPVYGLIFLFKYRPDEEPYGKLVPDNKDIYFAQQVINNACATQAIVNLLLNLDQEKVSLGPILENFRSFSLEMDPSSRGLCLSNSQEIRELHNSFARQNFLEIEAPKNSKDDNSYHFVTYVPVKGHVYELDGLKQAPIDLGPIPEGKDWLSVVQEILTARVQRHITSDITFNLMAVVENRKLQLERQLKEINKSTYNTEDKAALEYRLKMLINEEDEKFARYRNENARRRHNYTPFLIELLKLLAKENKLTPLVEKAAEEEEKRTAAKKQKTGA